MLERGPEMAKKKYTMEQIITKLRQIEVMVAQGKTMEESCRAAEIRPNMFYRWKQRYGGMQIDQAKRYKELEKENAQLKKLVADQALDISMLEEVSRGNF